MTNPLKTVFSIKYPNFKKNSQKEIAKVRKNLVTLHAGQKSFHNKQFWTFNK